MNQPEAHQAPWVGCDQLVTPPRASGLERMRTVDTMQAAMIREYIQTHGAEQEAHQDRKRCESCGVKCSTPPFYGHTVCRDCDPVDWRRPTARAREQRRAIVAAAAHRPNLAEPPGTWQG